MGGLLVFRGFTARLPLQRLVGRSCSTTHKKVLTTHALVEWLNFFKDAHKRTEKEVNDTVKDEGVRIAYSILKRHEPTKKYKDWYDLYGSQYADHMDQEIAKASAEADAKASAKASAEATIQERTEVAQKMLNGGCPVAEIAKYTGLTEQEVEALQKPVL